MQVAFAVLTSSYFYRLFDHLHAENFEISADAFSSVKELLCPSKGWVLLPSGRAPSARHLAPIDSAPLSISVQSDQGGGPAQG